MKNFRISFLACLWAMGCTLSVAAQQQQEDMNHNEVYPNQIREEAIQRLYETNRNRAIQYLQDQPQPGNYQEAWSAYQAILDTNQEDVSPYWIGVQCEPAENVPILSELPGIGRLFHRGGLIVNSVTEDSPAFSGGLREGDALITFNETPLYTIADLTDVIREAGETECKVQVVREERPLILAITPAQRPEMTEQDDPDEAYQQAWMQYWVDQQARDPWMGRNLNSGYFNLNNLQLPDDVELSMTFKGSNAPVITFKRGDDKWVLENWNVGELPEDLQVYYWSLMGIYSASGYPSNGYDRNYYAIWDQQWKSTALPPGYHQVQTDKAELMNRIDDLSKQLDALREAVEDIKKD